VFCSADTEYNWVLHALHNLSVDRQHNRIRKDLRYVDTQGETSVQALGSLEVAAWEQQYEM
jgi:hypothetical protein